jgi:hypothetical protein
MAAVVHQEVRVTGPSPSGLPHDLLEFRVRGEKAYYAVQAVAAVPAEKFQVQGKGPNFVSEQLLDMHSISLNSH